MFIQGKAPPLLLFHIKLCESVCVCLCVCVWHKSSSSVYVCTCICLSMMLIDTVYMFPVSAPVCLSVCACFLLSVCIMGKRSGKLFVSPDCVCPAS